jgi:membrane protease YdiL (CAAX protease family)
MSDWPLPGEFPDPPLPVSAEQAALPDIPPAPYPFWGYKDLGFFLLAMVGGILIAIVIGAAFVFLFPYNVVGIVVVQFVSYGVGILALYGIIAVRYGHTFWDGLRWGHEGSLGVWLLAGVATAIAGSLLAVAIGAEDIGDVPMKDLLSSRLAVTVIGLLAVTMGPLLEELTFRGFLLPLLVRDLGAAAGVVTTSVLFSLLHGPQYGWAWQALVPLVFAGVCFGAARLYSGSTGAATAMHVVYNLTVFLAFLAQGGLKDLP